MKGASVSHPARKAYKHRHHSEPESLYAEADMSFLAVCSPEQKLFLEMQNVAHASLGHERGLRVFLYFRLRKSVVFPSEICCISFRISSGFIYLFLTSFSKHFLKKGR